MLIWGTKGRYKTLSKGTFFCPECKQTRNYEHKRAAKYFTLYFIPIFSMQDYGDFVECKFCGTTFKPEVLSFNRPAIEKQLTQFIELMRSEVERGVSLNEIAVSLKQMGAEDDAVRNIIAIVSNGTIKECNECKTVFTGSLQYCSNCGGKLSQKSF
jgi:hypothetical protein